MKQKKILLAIDLHDEPYYGESVRIHNHWVEEGRYKLLLVCSQFTHICEDGYRYNLAVKMVKRGKVAEIALKLIEQAQRFKNTLSARWRFLRYKPSEGARQRRDKIHNPEIYELHRKKTG